MQWSQAGIKGGGRHHGQRMFCNAAMMEALESASCPFQTCLLSAKAVTGARRVLELGRVATVYAKAYAELDDVGLKKILQTYPGKAGVTYKRGWIGSFDRLVDTDTESSGDLELKGTQMNRMRLFYPIASALEKEGRTDAIPHCVPRDPALAELVKLITPASGNVPNTAALTKLIGIGVASLVAAADNISPRGRRGANYAAAIGIAISEECLRQSIELSVPPKRPPKRPRSEAAIVPQEPEAPDAPDTEIVVQRVNRIVAAAGSLEKALRMLDSVEHTATLDPRLIGMVQQTIDKLQSSDQLLQVLEWVNSNANAVNICGVSKALAEAHAPEIVDTSCK